MLLEQILSLATVLVLAATLPLSLVAVRGFRGAPFGAVLRPLPVVLVAYVGLNAVWVLDVSVPPAYQIATSSVATAAALFSAARLVVLLTERRKL